MGRSGDQPVAADGISHRGAPSFDDVLANLRRIVVAVDLPVSLIVRSAVPSRRSRHARRPTRRTAGLR
jgi:hypothetical protein